MSFDFPGLEGHVYDEQDSLQIVIDPVTKMNKLMGCGSFGAVYLGKLNQSGKVSMLVAVKVHHPGYAPDHMLIDEYNFLKLLGGKHNVIELLTHQFTILKEKLSILFILFLKRPHFAL